MKNRLLSLVAHLFPLALGASAGLLAMSLFGATLEAAPAMLLQSAIHIHADAGNNCQWKQPAADLAAANAIKVRYTVDAAPAVNVQQVCTGTAAPFTCGFVVPLQFQTVGAHTLVVEGANVDPVDGTLTAFVQLISGQYIVDPLISPPAPGSGFSIIKVIAAVAAALVGLFHYFGHH